MVDVTAKAKTIRKAKARGIVKMDPKLETNRKGEIAKGNVLTTAKIAGIMAAKNRRTYSSLSSTGIDRN